MAAYCIPPKDAAKFTAALKGGQIDPAKLADMTSGERRKFFEPIVGEANAEEVNALFESKLLLKDQKAGLVRWAKSVGGITEPARRDLLNKISKLDKILNPADEKKFLSDLAASKLGTTVTADEAKEIFDLAKAAQDAKAVIKNGDTTDEAAIAYGRAEIALSEKVESLKPNGRSWGGFALEVAGIPRATKSTFDISAPLNQGWGMEGSGNWADAVGKMLRYFNDEENFQNLRGWIRGHKYFERLHDAGLSITELGANIAKREEALPSSLVEQAFEHGITKPTGAVAKALGAPFLEVPNLVRASNRAYVGFNNYVRFKTAVDWVDAARLAGEDVSPGSQILKDISRKINNFSGRGDIGSEAAAPYLAALNTIFFSPRKNIATAMVVFDPVNWLNPATNRFVRMKATKMLIGSVLYTAAALGMARAMGYEVDLNPTSTNFLGYKAGKTVGDITGGVSTFIRFMARLVMGTGISAAGKPIDYGKDQFGQPFHSDPFSQVLHSRANIVWQYLLTKLSPGIPSVFSDALHGKDPAGRPFTVTQEMRNQLAPMTIDSFVDVLNDDPENMAAIMPTLLSVLGASMRTMAPSQNEGKYDVWGDPNGTPHDDVLDKTLSRLAIMPDQPEKMIRGVKLTPEQYDAYQQYSGKRMRARLSQIVRTPSFANLPQGRQEEVLRKEWNHQREKARTDMLSTIPGLIQQARQAKIDLKQIGSPAAVARRAAQ